MMMLAKAFFIIMGFILCNACIFISRGFILKTVDKKLISEIGKQVHLFYKHRFSGDRDSSYLEHLLDEARERGFSNSENVKWAEGGIGSKK